MKPLNRKNYGSIPHLSNSKLGENDHFIDMGQELILTEKKRDRHDTILVFEKYDGSNVGIAKKEGNIFALTRKGYEASTSPYRQHHEFTKWVKERDGFFKKILKGRAISRRMVIASTRNDVHYNNPTNCFFLTILMLKISAMNLIF